MDLAAFGRMTFSAAFPVWLASRVRLSPATRHEYLKNYKRLAPTFADRPLEQIDIQSIFDYRDRRAKVAGPGRINKEISTLTQILTRAGVWARFSSWYEPLPLPKDQRGIALDPEEEAHLFKVAATRPRWVVPYLCLVISRNTTCCPGELRSLTLANIDTKEFKWIRVVRGVKNSYRVRSLACNADARWALRLLFQRAQRQGARLPQHYLLPGRGPNPTKPMVGWYVGFRSLRTAAAKEYPRLARVRFYEAGRHTAASRLLEDPRIPFSVIEHVMGHALDSQTKRIYTHLRSTIIDEAVGRIASGHQDVRFRCTADPPPRLSCASCGAEFVQERTTQAYCSPRCRKREKKRRQGVRSVQ